MTTKSHNSKLRTHAKGNRTIKLSKRERELALVERNGFFAFANGDELPHQYKWPCNARLQRAWLCGYNRAKKEEA